jgi:mannose-6-phosphate isomerase-like protein (cupin superfamily)
VITPSRSVTGSATAAIVSPASRGQSSWTVASRVAGTVSERRSESAAASGRGPRRELTGRGRHTDTAEETQFFVSGSGDLLLDAGTKPVRAGDVIVLTEGTVHDLHNTGSEDLRVIGFFSAPSVEQHWTDEEWPGAGKVTKSPNA